MEFEYGVGIVLAIALAFVARQYIAGSANKKDKKAAISAIVGSDTMDNVVGKVDDFQIGDLKEVKVGKSGKVLVVQEDDGFHAVSSKCTHYAAPLKNGVYCDGKVRCPWHGACFDVRSGDIEEFPGMDGLHQFPVRVEGDDVIVTTNEADLKSFGKGKTPCSRGSSSSVYVVVGAGAAGMTCVETLRTEGFTGEVILIGKEKHLPYDRPKLSKAMKMDVSKILMRQRAWFDEGDVELMLGKEVTSVNVNTKRLSLQDGTEIAFDKILIATGGIPRSLPVEGMDFGNIFQLRDTEHAHQIVQVSEGKDLVIIGSSFIGMEVASCLAAKCASVTVIGMEKVPFERVLGPQIGELMQNLHEEKGVTFKMQRTVKQINGSGGVVTSVVLDNDEEVMADVVVIGAGVVCGTQFIKGDVTKERDGSIMVDTKMQAAQDTFVAGDIARFPYFATGENVRIEHWGMAQHQGRIAGLNMMGKNVDIHSVPYFWTVQYGKSLRYCGFASSYDEIVFQKDDSSLAFLAWYVKDGKVNAVASLLRDPVVTQAAALLEKGTMPSLDVLKQNNFDLSQFL